MKRLAFDKQAYIQSRFDKARDKNRSLFQTFPKYSEFLAKVQERILFDNSKSEDFDVFPLRFWNLAERKSNSAHAHLKRINLGAEFIQHLLESYFEQEQLKCLDVRTVLDKLKLMEADSCDFYSEAGNGSKQSSKAKQLKYRFMPVETH